MSKFEKERQRKMSTKFNDFLKEQLQDPEFQKEYEALQPEHAIMQAIIDARKLSGLTQKELSARTGIAQSDISKLECGNANPSIRTLQRLALAMGMDTPYRVSPEQEINFVNRRYLEIIMKTRIFAGFTLIVCQAWRKSCG